MSDADSQYSPERLADFERGREMVEHVYGFRPEWELTPLSERTLGDLFGGVWGRSALSVRDRRLLVIGVIAYLARTDLIELQVFGALRNGELTPDQLPDLALHLAYYVGWPKMSPIEQGIKNGLAMFERHLAAGAE
jgi:4-carboxymuconolactone decarboxylase